MVLNKGVEKDTNLSVPIRVPGEQRLTVEAPERLAFLSTPFSRSVQLEIHLTELQKRRMLHSRIGSLAQQQ